MKKLIPSFEIYYNKTKISYHSIKKFDPANGTNRDQDNAIRESVIGAIINKKIPDICYLASGEWRRLRLELNKYIETLGNKMNIIIVTVECIHRAGRMYHYDFDILLNNIVINVEFKFNASCVIETPQFASPCKPSQFLDLNFEEWYYDNYLTLIAEYGNIIIPDRDTYIKTIGSNNVECMKLFKEKYDNDKDFNMYCKKIDKTAIKEFIQMCNLDISILSDYLLTTQTDKIYMCYKDHNFYHDMVDTSLYIIKNVIQKEPTNFICETNNGCKLEVKLRFKNGCGLQFPAFQIKRKIPTVKQLKILCSVNNIPSPKLKKNILELLDKHSIIY